jgi:serine/threonine-protein kinase
VNGVINVAEMLLGQRRFDEAEAAVDAGLALDGGDPTLRRMKLELLWSRIDLATAERTLAAWNSDSATDLADRAMQAMYRRDFAAASGLFARAIAASRDVATYPSFGEYIPAAFDWRLRQALCAARLGHSTGAATLYREIQADAGARLARKPENLHVEVALRLALGEALAGLGQAKEAEAEGRRATAAIPESGDAWEGQIWQQYLAQILATNGDAASAVPLIAHLLVASGNHALSPARLRLDPVWDPIRQNPLFQALLEKHAAVTSVAESAKQE